MLYSAVDKGHRAGSWVLPLCVTSTLTEMSSLVIRNEAYQMAHIDSGDVEAVSDFLIYTMRCLLFRRPSSLAAKGIGPGVRKTQLLFIRS